MNWSDVAKAAPKGLELLGSALALTGVGAPAGAIVGGLGAILGHAIGQDPTPENVAAAIADPALQAKLIELQETNKAQLQQLLIQRDIAQMQETTKIVAAGVENTRDARSMHVQTHGYAPQVLSTIIVAVWGAMNFLIVTQGIHTGLSDMTLGRLLGTLDAAVLLVLNFWFGGNKDAAQNAQMLFNSTPQEKTNG